MQKKPRLTSKIVDLPSQFDALVSEELRDACKAATEAWAGEGCEGNISNISNIRIHKEKLMETGTLENKS